MLPVNATHQIAVMTAMSAEPVTLDQLVAKLPIERAAIVAAAGRLVIRGLIERQDTGVYGLSQTGLTVLRDGLKVGGDPVKRRKDPVYADSLRQRAWRAMRLTPRFTVGDIVLRAKQDEKDAEDSIRRFCHHLARAGYLVELPARARGTALSSPGYKVWRLKRNTGENAPHYRQASRTFKDRNTHEVFPCV